MSIEKLEEILQRLPYFLSIDNKLITIINTMNELIDYDRALLDTFKNQSDQIADLRQQLARKEDVIDVNNIKIGGTG